MASRSEMSESAARLAQLGGTEPEMANIPRTVSNTLTADPCVEVLEEAILKYGPPEIMNTDCK